METSYEFESVDFIEEIIDARYFSPPAIDKKPGCPDFFIWRNATFQIISVISEWHDYRRRGRATQNMRPAYASIAQARGSWGVGIDYFRVETESGRIFDIYFDRAPRSVDARKGQWYMHQELIRK
jgi:hypothetical protein